MNKNTSKVSKVSKVDAKHILNYYRTNIPNLRHLESQLIDTLSESDIENEYNPVRIDKLQNYMPIYSLFFEMNERNSILTTLKTRYQFKDMNSVVDTDAYESNNILEKPVFIKYAPLLDPIKFMIGKYENESNILNLPNISSNGQLDTDIHKKISTVHNSAYTDCFFSFLSSTLLNQHNMKHAVDFYGTCSGIQDKYKMDITDDFEYLNQSDFFISNIPKLFTISNPDMIPRNNCNQTHRYHVYIFYPHFLHALSNDEVPDLLSNVLNLDMFPNNNCNQSKTLLIRFYNKK